MVMEYIDGVTLQQVLAHHGPPSLGLTLEIARQTLVALGYLHHQGYVHRDISSDNLMLSRNFDGAPLIKLIDLGIAKRLGGEGQLTRTGTFLGKLRYSSPEQFAAAEGSAQVDARSDLYAFALVLYELLTGRFPVPGEGFSQLIAGHLFREPLAFEDSDPKGQVPPALRRLVLQGLEKEPARRMAGAEEFLERLEAFQDLHVSYAAEVTEVLESAATSEPEIVPEPGSTQRALDRRFDPGATPSPSHAGLPAPTAAGPPSVPERTLAFEEDAAEAPPAGEAPPGTASGAAPGEGSGPTTLERERTAILEAGDISAARDSAREETSGVGSAGAADPTFVTSESGERRLRVQELLSQARALRGDGQLTEAVEAIESTLAVDPNHSQARELLDQTRKALLERREREERNRAAAAAARELSDRLEQEALESAGPEDRLDPVEAALEDAETRFGPDTAFDGLRLRLDELRRQRREARIEELLGDARGARDQDDLERCTEALGQLLQLAPEHRQGQALAREVETERERRETERKRAQALARASRDVEALLEKGELDAAELRLQLAGEECGDAPALEPLQARLEDLRRRADADALVARAREHAAAGAFAEARQTIDRALEQVTDHPEAKALRDGIAEAARRHSEEEAAERRIREAEKAVAASLRAGDLEQAAQQLEFAIETLGSLPAFTELTRRLEAARRKRLESQLTKLLAGAQKQIGAGDPESATGLLRELLELDPDHSVARALLGETESEKVRRQNERKREEALAASVAEIGSLLDRSALGGAEKKLKSARAHWGEHEDLLLLQRRLSELRKGKARAEARRRLEAAVRGISASIVDGELARAEQELATAAAEHGNLEELRHLRQRLERAQRAARETPLQPPAAPPPPRPAAEPEAEVETEAGEPLLPPSPPRRWWPAAAVTAAIVIAVGVWWLLSGTLGTESPEGPAATTAQETAAANSSGTLVLDALPWAEVTFVRDADGELRDLGPQTHTPLVLHLPPGSYTLGLRHPSVGSPTEITVEMPPSGTVERLVDLGKVDADAYFAKVGW
jgi:serine/threonine-protein kinase